MLTVSSVRSARLECMSVGCELPATHSVKATIPINNCTCDKVELFCGLRLCVECAGDIKLKEVLPPSARNILIAELAEKGMFDPDFGNSQVIPVSLTDVSFLRQEAANATFH